MGREKSEKNKENGNVMGHHGMAPETSPCWGATVYFSAAASEGTDRPGLGLMHTHFSCCQCNHCSKAGFLLSVTELGTSRD